MRSSNGAGRTATDTVTDKVLSRNSQGKSCLNFVAVFIILTVTLIQVAPAVGQESSRGNGDVPADVREHYAQIIRAQAVLIQIPQMFIKDEVLEVQRQEFADALDAAMISEDGRTTGRLDRMAELMGQALAAPGQQEALLEEGRELRDALLATASSVRSRPAVAAAAKPLIATLTEHIEQIEGIDAQTLSIATDQDLLLEVVTAMIVFGR